MLTRTSGVMTTMKTIKAPADRQGAFGVGTRTGEPCGACVYRW